MRSIWCGLSPRPTDSEPCGSKSTSSTLRPYSASEAPRLMVVVVLPTPPFWLHIEITRACRGSVTGRGSGRCGHRSTGGSEDDLGGLREPLPNRGASTVVVATGNWSGSPDPGPFAAERAASSTAGPRMPHCRNVFRTRRHRSWCCPLIVCPDIDSHRCRRTLCRLTAKPPARLYASPRPLANPWQPSCKSGETMWVAPRRECTSSASPVEKPVHDGGLRTTVGKGEEHAVKLP